MDNPWNDIKLDDYENHMSLDSVKQLQALCDMMCSQFKSYPVSTVMILGVAGGNGLRHVDSRRFQKIYGVDINNTFLEECVRRYPELNRVFIPIQVDLRDKDIVLPRSDIIVANLLIEYIGYKSFQHVVRKVAPLYVTCGIQVNPDCGFVSDSPYFFIFDGLKKIHHQVNEKGLTQAMKRIGYKLILSNEVPLPNGRKLVRLDFALMMIQMTV